MNLVIKLLQKLKLYAIVKTIKDIIIKMTPKYKKQKRKMIAFYSQFVHSDDLCFDVGANTGNRTEIFLELGARVVVIEPQTSCIRILEEKFGEDKKITIIPKALGEKKGEAELKISDATTISSLSQEWINSVKASGRFSAYNWEKAEKVQITTFDELIDECGKPVFCKIDVEGYEYEVLKGLTQPVGVISFEFTPEHIAPAISSIKHLAGLGNTAYNYSIGESMKLVLQEWVTVDEIIQILTTLPDKTVFGDVYARFLK